MSEPAALFQPSCAVLLSAQAQQARRLGFRGAMIVHPAQVAILNEAYARTAEEVAWAKRVVEADAKARAEGRCAFVVDGRMADPPVVRREEDILARAG